MKKAGATRARTAELVFVAAMVVLGASYIVTLPPKQVTTTTQGTLSTQTSTPTPTTASTQTSVVSTSSSLASSSASQPISHVIIILMENEEYSSVIGSAAAPYEDSLVSSYASAGDYFAVAHPSLPNYLALVAGSTFGVNSDCLPTQCGFPSSMTTIATLLDSHHLSWKEYAESMPANCSQVDSSDGLYFPKHNPFVYFGAITGTNATGTASNYCDSHVVSMDQFYLDLQAGDVPNYSFITPNICHDAHSCPLETGDEWLSTVVPTIANSSSFASTALFIVYDEGSASDATLGGGQVPCILVSPFAKAGYVSQVQYTHYSLLATVEELLNLGNLGRNDATATPMTDLFTSRIHMSG